MGTATAVSDIERAEHLNYADGKGVKRVTAYNNGVQVNVATEETLQKSIGDETTRVAVVGSITYVGKAPIGSLTSAAVWKIKKVDETSGVAITWADGNPNYDNVWDNYATLTYS